MAGGTAAPALGAQIWDWLKKWISNLFANVWANLIASFVLMGLGGAGFCYLLDGSMLRCIPVGEPLFSHVPVVIVPVGRELPIERPELNAFGFSNPRINIQASKAFLLEKDDATGKETGEEEWKVTLRISYRRPGGGFAYLGGVVNRNLRDFQIFDKASLNCRFRVDWTFIEEPKAVKFDSKDEPPEDSPKDGFLAVSIHTSALDEDLAHGCRFDWPIEKF